MPFVFLRDDDVFKEEKELSFIFKFLIKNKIKCSYSIIPAILEKTLINFFNKNIRYSSFFDVIQHGYSHNENKRRIEFGKGINLETQYKGIKRGYSILKNKFKTLFSPVYVPPFHNYDYYTTVAAYMVGHKAISASRKIKKFNRRLIFLRCNINVNIYDKNITKIDIAFLKKLTLSKIKRKEIIGIYFHHNTLCNTENIHNFIEYVFFLKWLEKKEIINFVKVSDLL